MAINKKVEKRLSAQNDEKMKFTATEQSDHVIEQSNRRGEENLDKSRPVPDGKKSVEERRKPPPETPKDVDVRRRSMEEKRKLVADKQQLSNEDKRKSAPVKPVYTGEGVKAPTYVKQNSLEERDR